MAQRTDGQLTTEANIIRDETAVGANTALRVGTMLDNLIDSKINIDRVSDSTSLGNSTTLVPSQNAVKTYVDANVAGLLTDNGNYDPTITSQYPTSGNTLSGGAVQKGDLWFISADGTMNGNTVYVGYSVRALITNPGATTDADWSISNVGIGYEPENVAHKSFDPGMGNSDVYYPSQKAVRDYVLNQIALSVPTYPLENANNKIQDITLDPNSSIKYPSNAAVSSFVAANLSTPSLNDVVSAGSISLGSFGATTPSITNIYTASTIDQSYAALNAITGTGGAATITNKDGNTSRVNANLLTSFRTHQLPDATGILALKVNGVGADNTGNIVVSAGGSVNTVKVSLTSADILSLDGTNALTLIPAQGADTLINVLKVWFKYNYVTNPYSGSGIYVQLGTAISIVSPTSGILSSGSSAIVRAVMNASAYNLSASAVVNQSVSLSTVTAPTGGDSTLDVYLTYDVITL